MDPIPQLLLALAIVIVVVKGSGYLSTRLGQPAALGVLAPISFGVATKLDFGFDLQRGQTPPMSANCSLIRQRPKTRIRHWADGFSLYLGYADGSGRL
jgi:hypothetical protein